MKRKAVASGFVPRSCRPGWEAAAEIPQLNARCACCRGAADQVGRHLVDGDPVRVLATTLPSTIVGPQGAMVPSRVLGTSLTITSAWLPRSRRLDDPRGRRYRHVFHRAICWTVGRKERVSVTPETGNMGRFGRFRPWTGNAGNPCFYRVFLGFGRF